MSVYKSMETRLDRSVNGGCRGRWSWVSLLTEAVVLLIRFGTEVGEMCARGVYLSVDHKESEMANNRRELMLSTVTAWVGEIEHK